MAETDSEDRTQAASARRLEQARARGDVPLSREISVVAGLGAAVLALTIGMPAELRGFTAQLAQMLVDPQSPGAALRSAAWMVLALVVPFAAAVLAASAASTFVQTGFLVNLSALRPNLGRLNPQQGLKRIASREALTRVGYALLKLAILAWAAWHALGNIVPDAGRTLLEPSGALLDRLGRDLLQLVMLVLGAQAGFAALDLLLVRLRYARRMRMTREELREETKDTEGDPHIKGKLRRLRTARARRRMMAAVPTATVVVTNPTHYAVALRYEAGMRAPVCVAKGVDALALRIRAVAGEHGVPVVENPPLARALHATVEIDQEIPVEHYRAVAEVIGAILRLRRRAA
jgi:flagellar biosynthesis protein FlhB